MANAKQVLDVQVSKGITAAQGNEHLRNRSEEAEKYAMSKGNYDPTRKHLNFEIVPGGKVRPIDTSRNIPERIADILGRRQPGRTPQQSLFLLRQRLCPQRL